MAKKVPLKTNRTNWVTDSIMEDDTGYSKTRKNALGGTTTKTTREKSLTNNERMQRQSTVVKTKVKTDKSGTVLKSVSKTKKNAGGYDW